MHVALDDIAPETVAFGVLLGLSVGWTGGSVLAGASLSQYLPLLVALLGAGTALFAVRSRT
jgi:hypothetical protein